MKQLALSDWHGHSLQTPKTATSSFVEFLPAPLTVIEVVLGQLD